MSAVYNGIILIVMLYVLALIFGVVQPAFDVFSAINHGMGGWASTYNDGILNNRLFAFIMIIIALFAGLILPEFKREDNTQSYRKR
jgi:hypothetical protein